MVIQRHHFDYINITALLKITFTNNCDSWKDQHLRGMLQLDLGGESPGYLEKDKHYREADAALLNVIYPTNLSKINTRRKEQV